MTYQKILDNLTFSCNTILLVCTKNSNPNYLVNKIIAKFKPNYLDYQFHNDLDCYVINGYDNKIKKEQILNMQSQLNYSGIGDDNLKVCYIQNLDNASKETLNSLLKLYEEPNENILNIISVSELNVIPITIKSRSQIFYLPSDDEALSLVLKKLNLSPDHWACKIFSNIEQLEHFCLSDNWAMVNEIYNTITTSNYSKFKKSLDLFKTLSYTTIKIVLQALLVNETNQNKLQRILEILENLQYNPIKPIIYTQLFSIMGDNDV